ncbi:MAG: hypothetical protein ACTHNS_06780 [Marmoricola sp.]
MSPLQKIAIGLVIVLLPAYFPAHPHPVWALYDALPDPIGWVLVVLGVRDLGRSPTRSEALDLDLPRWMSVLALLVSVPLWFPQLNHLLVPAYNPGLDFSGQWAASLPQSLFGFFLARQIGRAGQWHRPRDPYVAGRFGVLTWGFAALVVLPAVAYGGGVAALVGPTLVLIGLVNIAFIGYLFGVQRRPWLGGPGPRTPREDARRPPPTRERPS